MWVAACLLLPHPYCVQLALIAHAGHQHAAGNINGAWAVVLLQYSLGWGQAVLPAYLACMHMQGQCTRGNFHSSAERWVTEQPRCSKPAGSTCRNIDFRAQTSMNTYPQPAQTAQTQTPNQIKCTTDQDRATPAGPPAPCGRASDCHSALMQDESCVHPAPPAVQPPPRPWWPAGNDSTPQTRSPETSVDMLQRPCVHCCY